MAYIKKLIGTEENLIGIARLHWIYVIKGLLWFAVFAGAGWFMNAALSRVVLYFSASTGARAVPAALMTISDSAMYFLMGGGFLIFFLFVMKVLVTEIGLTSRRVIHKEGLLFIKVKEVDLEEIRGENLDLGWFGRILGYGYILLDCRFIGDVRLPAIENPERFLKALHMARSKSQDSLSVVLGKGNAAPLDVQAMQTMNQQQPEIPQPSQPQPTPEIQPVPPGQAPEVTPPQPGPESPTQPVPHGPPPTEQPPAQPQPDQPMPQPTQPVPMPPPSEPPLQPPVSAQLYAAAQGTPQAPQPQQPAAQAQVQQPIDPKILAEVVKQVMPQMAQQVAQELAGKGMLNNQNNHDQKNQDKGVDTDLIASFDEAALDTDGNLHDHRNKMEHVIH